MTHGLADDDGQFAPAAAGEVIELRQDCDGGCVGAWLGPWSDAHRVRRSDFIVRSRSRWLSMRMRCLRWPSSPEALAKPGGPRVLTPHPGEFARLTGELPEASQRAISAAALARRDPAGNTIVVLKGHETVVTDGQRYSINQTGNPGMATGGVGRRADGHHHGPALPRVVAVRCGAAGRARAWPGGRFGGGGVGAGVVDRE